MKVNQLKTGVILSYISQGLHIILTLFYTPVMLRLLGQSEYGIYQIVYSVVGFLGLMNFGFSGSYLKFYSKAKKEDVTGSEVAKLNATYTSIFAIIALLVLVLGLWMAANTDVVLGGKMTQDELDIAMVLMYILVFNSVFQFLNVVFNNYIIAHEKFIPLQLIQIITTALNPCLTFPMLLMGYGSIGMGVALLVISVSQFAFSSYYSIAKLNMKFDFRKLQFGVFKDIGSFAFFIFLESVISMINISLDRFLLGKLAGSVAAAVYAVGGQINTLYMTLSTSISSVFSPRVNRMVEEGGKDKELSDLFIKVGRFQFIILYAVLCGFAVFGRRFVNIWVGDGYEESYIVAMILIIPNTINLIQNVAYEIQRAKYLQKYRSYMWIGVAVANAISSIYLIKLWGASGAALGTCLAWIVGSGFLMNWFYSKYVALDVKTFWFEILQLSKGGIIPLIIGFSCFKILQDCHVIIFFLSMLLFLLIYVFSMYYLGLRKSDQQAVNDICIKLTSKYK